MGIRQDQCYKVCRIIDDYLANRPRERDELIVAVRTVFKEADRKTENSSENPNNCEHITEDGVTCAKYPACDDCLDNPLNKVKGSERLVKGTEKPNNCEEPQYEMGMGTLKCDNCSEYGSFKCTKCDGEMYFKDEPQTDCAWMKGE